MVEDFQECASCAAKSGKELLCGACLHNRTLVYGLQEHLREAEDELESRRVASAQAVEEYAFYGRSGGAAVLAGQRKRAIALAEENDELRDCLVTGALDYLRYRKRAVRLLHRLWRRGDDLAWQGFEVGVDLQGAQQPAREHTWHTWRTVDTTCDRAGGSTWEECRVCNQKKGNHSGSCPGVQQPAQEIPRDI